MKVIDETSLKAEHCSLHIYSLASFIVVVVSWITLTLKNLHIAAED